MADLFADLLGQPRAVSLLRAALERRRLAPAYLFAGADGVGRRLGALRFLEGVIVGVEGSVKIRRRLEQGNHPDLLWVEPTYSHQGRLVPRSRAEEEGVNRRAPAQLRLEQVREVTRFLARRPVESARRLVVREEVEARAEAAANALLTTLEDPGGGLLLLIGSAPDRLLATIRSRCQQIPFVRLGSADLRAALDRSATATATSTAAEAPPGQEGELVDPPEIIEMAAGSPGALLSHRQEWRSLPEGIAARLRGLDRDPLEALALARDLSEALEVEQQLWLLDWWQLALWRQWGDVSQIRRIERLRSHLRAYVQPRLAWEVTLLEVGRMSERLPQAASLPFG
jgi:DNA polymerase-3 subunit delta'